MTDTTFLLFIATNLIVIGSALMLSLKKSKTVYEKMVEKSHTPEEEK